MVEDGPESGSAVAITTAPFKKWIAAGGMKQSIFSPQMKAPLIASTLPCLCIGSVTACPSSSTENPGVGLIKPVWSACWCARPLCPLPLAQSSHLKSQPTKVWPFLALQLEFPQRHIKDNDSCFALFCSGIKPAVKCRYISQIFCVNKAKALRSWHKFYCILIFLVYFHIFLLFSYFSFYFMNQ